MDSFQVIAEGGETLIAGWLSVTLSAGLRLPEDESEERRQFLLEGAKAALEQLAPAGAWLGERLQAVQFLCAHSAAMDWQGQANSPHLVDQVREKAQRFAAQMMALTGRQLATLARLRDQRRREDESAERRALRKEAHATNEQLARGSAFTAELERMMELGGEVDEAPEATPPTVPSAGAAARPRSQLEPPAAKGAETPGEAGGPARGGRVTAQAAPARAPAGHGLSRPRACSSRAMADPRSSPMLSTTAASFARSSSSSAIRVFNPAMA